MAYLGPQGTFSEEAAVKHFGGQTPAVPCASIDEVFRQVKPGSVGYGVVPVENSTEGTVGRTLDLLLAPAAKVCGEVLLPVHQCLMSKGGKAARHPQDLFAHAEPGTVPRGGSHSNLPRPKRIAVVSNAEAARIAAKGRRRGGHRQARPRPAVYGLNLLAGNIEDEPNNTTRFVVIAAQDAAPSGKDKTSLVMSTRNVPGAIHELLTPLAATTASA